MHHRQEGRFLSQTQEELILISAFGLLCLGKSPFLCTSCWTRGAKGPAHSAPGGEPRVAGAGCRYRRCVRGRARKQEEHRGGLHRREAAVPGLERRGRVCRRRVVVVLMSRGVRGCAGRGDRRVLCAGMPVHSRRTLTCSKAPGESMDVRETGNLLRELYRRVIASKRRNLSLPESQARV